MGKIATGKELNALAIDNNWPYGTFVDINKCPTKSQIEQAIVEGNPVYSINGSYAASQLVQLSDIAVNPFEVKYTSAAITLTFTGLTKDNITNISVDTINGSEIGSRSNFTSYSFCSIPLDLLSGFVPEEFTAKELLSFINSENGLRIYFTPKDSSKPISISEITTNTGTPLEITPTSNLVDVVNITEECLREEDGSLYIDLYVTGEAKSNNPNNFEQVIVDGTSGAITVTDPVTLRVMISGTVANTYTLNPDGLQPQGSPSTYFFITAQIKSGIDTSFGIYFTSRVTDSDWSQYANVKVRIINSLGQGTLIPLTKRNHAGSVEYAYEINGVSELSEFLTNVNNGRLEFVHFS